MKKFFTLLLSVILLCSLLTACGKAKAPEQNNPDATENTSTTAPAESTPNDDSADWGVSENIITEKQGAKARAYVNFPSLAGIEEGTGKIAYQPDYSLVILDAQYSKSSAPSDLNVDEILSAYFSQTAGIMKAYRRSDHKDFNFEITSKKTLTINDYEMCKYTGKHTFTVSGAARSIAFVAYATKLKANDAAVYWMVLDDTSDQTLGSTIESHADKMAKSFHE